MKLISNASFTKIALHRIQFNFIEIAPEISAFEIFQRFQNYLDFLRCELKNFILPLLRFVIVKS